MLVLYIYSPPQFPYRLSSHQNYLPTGTGALPNGIKRPTHSADYSPLHSNGVKNARAIYLLSYSVQTGSRNNTASYTTIIWILHKGIKRPKRVADHSPRLSAEVKKGIAIYLLSSAAFKPVLEPTHRPFQWLMGLFTKG
jgi:hypothetical protein